MDLVIVLNYIRAKLIINNIANVMCVNIKEKNRTSVKEIEPQILHKILVS